MIQFAKHDGVRKTRLSHALATVYMTSFSLIVNIYGINSFIDLISVVMMLIVRELTLGSVGKV